MNKVVQDENTERLADTLRLVADLMEQLNGPKDIRLPGVLQSLKEDVLELFEKHEKIIEGEPEGLDMEPSPDDNLLHGET